MSISTATSTSSNDATTAKSALPAARPASRPNRYDTSDGIRAGNVAVSIDATTGQCSWDGRPVDYARVVGDLVRLGGDH